MTSETPWVPEAGDLTFIEHAAGEPHPVLLEIEAAARPEGIPILDRASGRVLAVLASGRRRIVEIGTAIGYSTLCMAMAMASDGRIVTVDPDTSRTSRARGFWRQAGIPDERIEVVSQPALDALGATGSSADARLDGPFDLAFIDAIKTEYGAYLEALVPRLAPGALVVADNVLWDGLVSGVRSSAAGPSASTLALRAFDREVLADPRFRGTILPVGDGLLVAVYGEPADRGDVAT